MSPGSLIGTSVGHIKLVELLGSGGMGEVYRGFDTRLQRHVAVKTIRAEHRPDQDMKSRFFREARLLSQIDHPAICKVYDLIEGERADYLIFELVAGVTLRRRLKAEDLNRREVLILAEGIANALAAAHSERIVHRDLKPENVMVTPEGDIKILDFGISTALNEPVTAATLLEIQTIVASKPKPDAEKMGSETKDSGDIETAETVRLDLSEAPTQPVVGKGNDIRDNLVTRLTGQGLVLGTLQYMSPEQARGESVTSACDLYSFGIMLQELLTLRSAYDAPELVQLFARVVSGETRPMQDEDPAVVALVEDLKRRSPEYRPTAKQTAERIRHILDEPARKRRKRLQWAAVSVSFTLLLFVLGVVFSLYTESSREADRANRAVAVAQEEQQRAEAVTKLLVDVFSAASPDQTQGEDVSARDLVLLGADQLEIALKSEPLLLAGLQEILGPILARLGDYEGAWDLLESSLALRSNHLPHGHPMIAESLHKLGALCRELGKAEQALGYLKDAQAMLSAEGSSAAQAAIEHELGIVHQLLNEPGQAEASYTRALSLYRSELGEESREFADTLNSLALFAWQQGDLEQARQRFEQVLPIYEKVLGDHHPDLGAFLNNFGLLYRDSGQHDKAESSLLRALDLGLKTLGKNHDQVAATHFTLARLFLRQGKDAQAEDHFERALDVRRRVFGFQHYSVGRSLIWLAEATRRSGRLERAGEFLAEGSEIMAEMMGDRHYYLYEVKLIEAELERDLGQTLKADGLFREAELLAEMSGGPDHPEVLAIRKARAREPVSTP